MPQGVLALDDRELEQVTPDVRAPVRFVVVAFCATPTFSATRARLRDHFVVGVHQRMRALLLFFRATMKALESNACFNHKTTASLGHVCGLCETRLARTALRSPCSAGRQQLKPQTLRSLRG